MSAGIISEKFIDINKAIHKFPEEIREIGFAVTLLHNHPHAPVGYRLVYLDNFTKSRYVSQEEAEKYFPCSWYQEQGEIIPYEFCDQDLPYSLQQVEQNLKTLSALNFKNYGTTIRPISNDLELETKQGHIYIPISKWNSQHQVHVSETTSNGLALTSCSAYSYCYITSMYAHVTGYGHDVQ